jgi:hypothetical protein
MRYPSPINDLDEDEDGDYCGATWSKHETHTVPADQAEKKRKALRKQFNSVQFAIV